MKATTIKDVAKYCNVSTYTVSSVLKNKGDISEETSFKVQLAVKELNYNPLRNIPSVETFMTKSIALVLPDQYSNSDEFFFRAIKTTLNSAQYYKYDFKIFSETNFIEHLAIDKGCNPHVSFNVAIFFCTNKHNSKIFKNLKIRGIKTALIRRSTKDKSVLCLNDNDEKGVLKALNYFYNNGHKKIAFVYTNNQYFESRMNAYKKFIYEKGLDPFVLNTLSIKENIQKNKVSALLCNEDTCAKDVMKQLLKEGIKIPEEVSVIGYNNNPLCENFYPEISSVNIPVENMLEKVCKLLIESNNVSINNTIVDLEFENELILRASVKGLK